MRPSNQVRDQPRGARQRRRASSAAAGPAASKAAQPWYASDGLRRGAALALAGLCVFTVANVGALTATTSAQAAEGASSGGQSPGNPRVIGDEEGVDLVGENEVIRSRVVEDAPEVDVEEAFQHDRQRNDGQFQSILDRGVKDDPAQIKSDTAADAAEAANAGGVDPPNRGPESRWEAEVDPEIAPEQEWELENGYVKLVNFQGPLFDEDVPKFKDVMQGSLADCYLVSTLSSVALANPQAIEDLVQLKRDANGQVVRNSEGEPLYVVTFHEQVEDGSWREVPVEVDADLYAEDGVPIYGSGFGFDADQPEQAKKQMELWFPLVEKAYAKWKGDNQYAKIGRGGLPSKAMEAVLGKQARFLYAGDTAYHARSPFHRLLMELGLKGAGDWLAGVHEGSPVVQRLLPRLDETADYLRSDEAKKTAESVLDRLGARKEIHPYTDQAIQERNWATVQRAVRSDAPLTAGTEPILLYSYDDKAQVIARFDDAGLAPEHIYSIVGKKVDPQTGERFVILSNPWRHGELRGADQVDDGVFLMPLAQFSQYFTSIAYTLPQEGQPSDLKLTGQSLGKVDDAHPEVRHLKKQVELADHAWWIAVPPLAELAWKVVGDEQTGALGNLTPHVPEVAARALTPWHTGEVLWELLGEEEEDRAVGQVLLRAPAALASALQPGPVVLATSAVAAASGDGPAETDNGARDASRAQPGQGPVR